MLKGKKYKVYPFILNDLIDDLIVVQNVKGVVILKQRQMQEMFMEIDEKRYEEIDDSFICSFFNGRYEDAIRFMLKNHLIYVEQEKQIKFERIEFFTNCEEIRKSLEANFSDHKLVNNILNIFDFNDFNCDRNGMEENLNIFILNPFNYKEFVELVKRLNERNMLFQVAFYYNKGFYFSNYFKKEWNAPCPVCFFEKVESELRAEAQAGINSFQMIIDLIYYKRTSFKTEILLNYYMIVPLIYVTVKSYAMR